MSDASELSTYIQTFPISQDLIEATNFDDPSATTLDTTVLESYCTEAIALFEATLGTYQGASYALHKTVAKHIVTILLEGESPDYGDLRDALGTKFGNRFIESFDVGRTLYPQTNAVRTPTADDSTKKPRFDRSVFDGFGPTNH